MKKVKHGDPLTIPAAAYNAFVDAALDHRARQRSQMRDADKTSPQSGIVLVKNESGADRSRFDILGITEPIIKRIDNDGGFQERIALRGVTPTSAHAGRFVVLLDALAIDTIGRAYVAGACLARVRMLDEAHTSADVEAGQSGQLASGGSGAALLWIEPIEERDDPAIAWAVIRFGGGGAATASAALSYVMVESAIGTAPPYIYTGRAVVPNGSGFDPPSGSDFDLYNLAEIGAGNSGVHAIAGGSIVAYWQDAASGAYYFDRSFYRGTY